MKREDRRFRSILVVVAAVTILLLYPGASVIQTTGYSTFVADSSHAPLASSYLRSSQLNPSSYAAPSVIQFAPHFTSESGLATGNSSCAVLSPFDHTCGFVVNPPSWAVDFSLIDRPIDYFHNGTYGIVYVNATTFNVLESQEIGGKVYPVACVVNVPSGTLVLSQTSTAVIAELPGGKIVTVAVPQYSFCSSVTSSSPNQKALVGLQASATGSATSQSLAGGEVGVEGFCYTGCYISETDSVYKVPSPPSDYTCGNPCATPPYFWTRHYIVDLSTFNLVDGEIDTYATCSPYGSGFICSFNWEMYGAEIYNNVEVRSAGFYPSVGDGMGDVVDNANDAYTNAIMCGNAWDYTQGVERSICVTMSNALPDIGIDFNSAFYSCANFPNSNLDYNSIYAYDQNSNNLIINWNPFGFDGCTSTYYGFDVVPQYVYFTFSL